MALKGILAAVALCAALTGCQNDVLVDDSEEGIGQTEYAIDFVSGFVDSRVQTKADPVKLEQYNTTMGVWGWRSDNELSNEPTFINQLVSYDADAQKWTYSPLKYWVTGSNYKFNAYSPYSDGAVINPSDGMISIGGIVADGTDWMVARAGQTASGTRIGQTVQFTMQHILFNKVVRARITDAVAADEGVVKVAVQSLTVGDLVSKGDFSQKLTHTPDPDNLTDRAAAEWTLYSAEPKQKLSYTAAEPLTTTYTNLIDALCVPQPLTADMKLLLTYTMEYSDGRVERFVFSETLADIFKNMSYKEFMSGNTYTISLIIGPETITFDAGSTIWTEVADSNETIN